MEVSPQTSQKIELVTKKEISNRTVLNIYGVFTFLGLILSIFTVPISINENMELFQNEELKMGSKEIKEFLTFIFGSSLVYFTLVNFYFMRKK